MTQSTLYYPLVDACQLVTRDEPLSRSELVPWAPPLDAASAPSLDAFMRSFLVPCFYDEWEAIEEHHQPSLVRSREPSPGFIVKETASVAERLSSWQINIYAAFPGGQVNTRMGCPRSPRPISALETYIMVYLQLGAEQRGAGWRLALYAPLEGIGQIFDWQDSENDLRGLSLCLLTSDASRTFMVPRFEFRCPMIITEVIPVASSAQGSSTKSALSAETSHLSTPTATILNRDRKCVMTGASASPLSGDLRVAHILPFSRPDLIDRLRLFYDPTRYPAFHARDGLSGQRRRVINHPSNLVTMLDEVERNFDRLAIGINPFMSLSARYVGGYTPEDSFQKLKVDFLERSLGWGSPLAALTPANTDAPGPALVSLLYHFRSVLAKHYRLAEASDFNTIGGAPAELARNSSASFHGDLDLEDMRYIEEEAWWDEDPHVELFPTGRFSPEENLARYFESMSKGKDEM